MKQQDFALAAAGAAASAWLVIEFSGSLVRFGIWEIIFLYILLLLITIGGLGAALRLGKVFPVAIQAARHMLVGIVATLIDLKMFEILIMALFAPITAKGISFIASTSLKYLGNKAWAFEKYGTESIRREISVFFAITAIGLLIDLSVFYFIIKIGAPPAFSPITWTKLAVIISALAAAVWNFLGYKFVVFKK